METRSSASGCGSIEARVLRNEYKTIARTRFFVVLRIWYRYDKIDYSENHKKGEENL